MKKEARQWTLWVHKETDMYLDYGTTPVLGGQKTCKEDFEEVIVVEQLPRRKKRRSKKARK